MKKELIIFDMDGTLINSGIAISNTINFVRENIGLPIMDSDILLSQINNPDINAAEYFYGTKEFTDEQTKLFCEYYDKNCVKEIALYDGIKDMLDELSKDYRLTIATNASIEFATKMVKYLNIDHYFEMIIGANCVEKPKPSPDMIIETIDKMNVEQEKAILIGDSLKDKEAAIRAKIDYILVDWGFTTYKEAEAVSNPQEIKNKILEFI